MRDRGSRAPRLQSHPLPGSWNGACTQGSSRNLGWSLGAPVVRTGTERQGKSSRPGAERSERAVGAVTWGNPLQGTLPSKGARRRTDSLEGEDDRGTELAGHLNQARADSETGEGETRRQLADAGASHRRGLAPRGLSPHAEGRCPRHRRTERGSVRGAPGGQPPVAPQPREDRSIPGTAGAAGGPPAGGGGGGAAPGGSSTRRAGPRTARGEGGG